MATSSCAWAQGVVYGGYDDVLLKLRTSGDDTVESLCTDREFLQIK